MLVIDDELTHWIHFSYQKPFAEEEDEKRVCVNCSFIHLFHWQSKPHPFFQAIHQTDQAVTMLYLHLVNSNNICSIFSVFTAHLVDMMKNI